MNILVPINSSGELDILSAVDNIECFCGYTPAYWIDKYNDESSIGKGILVNPINNRYEISASFTDENEFSIAVKKAKEYGIRLYVVLNFKHYPQHCYKDLDFYLKDIMNIGVSRLIICDVGLLNYIQNYYDSFKVSISCLSQVTNSEAVKFYKRFSVVDRIVFPRHMSVKEITRIANANPDIEFEYFIFSNKCLYDDGYCRAIHYFTPICRESFKYTVIHDNDTEENLCPCIQNVFHNWIPANDKGGNGFYRWGNFLCSACSLANLSKIKNIVSVKLSIRGKGIEQRLAQVEMAKEVISIAERDNDINLIKNKINEFYGHEICTQGLNCMMNGIEG